MSSVVITGINGFVGRHLATHLRAAGFSVFGITRQSIAMELDELGVQNLTLKGWPTRNDNEEWETALSNVSDLVAVVHLAGESRLNASKSLHNINPTLTSMLVKALNNVNARPRLILASSVGALDYPFMFSRGTQGDSATPRPRSSYGKSKLSSEREVSNYSGQVCIARLGTVIGSGMRRDSHVRRLDFLTHNTFAGRHIIPRLAGSFPVVTIEDCIDALFLLITHDQAGGSFNIVGANIQLGQIIANLNHRSRPRYQLRLPMALASSLPAKIGPAFAPLMVYEANRMKAIGWSPTSDYLSYIKDLKFSPDNRQSFTFITGVCSGLGKAAMEHERSLGNPVIGIDIDEVGLSELQVLYPDSFFLKCDLSAADQVEGLGEFICSFKGDITKVVLAAGVGKKCLVSEETIHSVRKTLEINLYSRVSLILYLLDSHRESLSEIILVSSSTAIQPLHTFSVYSATNSAVLAFGIAAAEELANQDIRLKVLVPGGMRTNFQATAGVRVLEKDRLLSPTKVYKKAVNSRRNIILVGLNVRVTAALVYLMPMSLRLKFFRILSDRLR